MPSGFVKEKDKVYKVKVDKYANVTLYEKGKTSNVIEAASKDKLIKHHKMTDFAKNTNEDIIFDGNTISAALYNFRFNNNKNIPSDAFIGIDLGKIKKIKEFSFRQGQIGNLDDKITHYKIEYSFDNNIWYDIDEKHDGATEYIKQDLDIFARYIRVSNLQEVINKWFAVRQISVKVEENEEVLKTEGNDKYLFGNIEVPSLAFEKVDKDTGAKISTNNTGKNYNAKFALYKVNDTLANVKNLNLNRMQAVQEFTLNAGSLASTTLNLSEYGRYALVETESPDNYKKMKPILLDLALTSRSVNGKNRTSVAWQPVSEGATNNQYNFTGTRDYGLLTIDYQNLANNNLISFKVKNEIKYQIEIKKIDTAADLITAQSRFAIKNKDTEGEANTFNDQVADLANGTYTFSNKDEGFVEGTYFIREITAPSGYKALNRNIKLEVSNGVIKLDNEVLPRDGALDKPDFKASYANGKLILEVKNKKLFNLHIKKRDKADIDKIQGPITDSNVLDAYKKLDASFTLEKENGSNNWTAVTIANNSNSFKTSDGYFNKPELEEGKYRLTETEAPSGYYKLKEPIIFTVSPKGEIALETKNGQVNQNAVAFSHQGSKIDLVVLVKNEQIKYKFKVRKLNKADSSLISKAQNEAAMIKILGSDKTQVLETVSLTSGEHTFQKNDNSKYPAGTYYIKEENAPDGFKKLDKLIKVQITETGVVKFLGYEAETGSTDVTPPQREDLVSLAYDKASDEELITLDIKNLPYHRLTIQKIDESKKGNDFDPNAGKDHITNGRQEEKALEGAKLSIKAIPDNGGNLGSVIFDSDEWNRNNVAGEYGPDGVVIWQSKTNRLPGIKLTEGKYKLEELEAPSGFNKFKPFEINVNSSGEISFDKKENPDGFVYLGSEGKNNPRPIIYAVDPGLRYDIKVYKLDKDKGTNNVDQYLSDAKFKISKDKEGNVEPEEKTADNVLIPLKQVDGKQVANNDDGATKYWLDSFKTIANNTAENDPSKGYKEGLYFLTETSSPLGYKKLEEAIPFYINKNGTLTIPAKVTDSGPAFDNNGIAEKDEDHKYKDLIEAEIRDDYKFAPKKLIVFKIKNEKNSITLKLKKIVDSSASGVSTGADAETTIDGVKFRLYDKDSTKNEPVGEGKEFITAGGGLLEIPKLTEGEYFLKETEVPVEINGKTTAEYKLNDKYYKIVVYENGTKLKIGEKALVSQNGTYAEVDKDDQVVLGELKSVTVENEALTQQVQELSFKNSLRYRIAFENNLYTANEKPRLSGMKFYLKPKSDSEEKIRLAKPGADEANLQKGYKILTDDELNNLSMETTKANNGVGWVYNDIAPEITDKKELHNPIFSLSPGTYEAEEINTAEQKFEKVKFEFTVADDGAVSIKDFEANTDNSGFGMVDGNIFKITQAVSETKSGLINIYNKRPMSFFVNKLNPEKERISEGKLGLLLARMKPEAGTVGDAGTPGDGGTLPAGETAGATTDNSGEANAPASETVNEEASENKPASNPVSETQNAGIDGTLNVEDQSVSYEINLAKAYEMDKGHKIKIPKELKSGTYVLTETSPPLGYLRTKTSFAIEIDQFKRTVKFKKLNKETKPEDANAPDVELELNKDEKELYTESLNAEKNDVNLSLETLNIVNRRRIYPHTGGNGILAHIVAGLSLMICSAFALKKRKLIVD